LARHGARSDQIAASEVSARSIEAVLTWGEWDLAQKLHAAGLAFDMLYHKVKWIKTGRPAVFLHRNPATLEYIFLIDMYKL
jgi:hypothetical protein